MECRKRSSTLLNSHSLTHSTRQQPLHSQLLLEELVSHPLQLRLHRQQVRLLLAHQRPRIVLRLRPLLSIEATAS